MSCTIVLVDLSEDDNNRNGKNMHKGWGLHHQHRLLENVAMRRWMDLYEGEGYIVIWMDG